MPQKKFNFTMGADPEFSFIIQGRRAQAKELMRLNLLRKKELKAKENGFEVGEHGNIGWDGCDSTAEIRPAPVNTPGEMVEHIRELITPVHKYLPLFDMSTLSIQAAVGGHIHFEIDEATHCNSKKIQLIHKKVSSFFLPIMISENKINLRIRCKSSYGTLLDFHGDNMFLKSDNPSRREYAYTYEFRTPSAEWLTTPKITEATFAYMGAVYNEIINKPENFKKYMNIVYKNEEQAKALHTLAISDYIGITESLFNRIKKAVKTFEYYPEYKEQIDYILNPKKVMEDKKKAEYNIVKGWRLKEETKEPNAKTLTSVKAFKEASKKIDIDKMSTLINITYNDDANVQLFTKELAEKSVAFNWKLKKNYFIFGLRKGIDSTIAFDDKKNIIVGMETIKTKSDQEAMADLMERIIRKYKSQTYNKTIDPITGELKSNEFIAIGLPYNDRIEKKTNRFIKLIYGIEKNKIKQHAVNYKNLIDDSEKPNESKGSLFKILNKVEENIPIDHTSQGAQRATYAKEAIIDEEIRTERENNEEEPISLCPHCNSGDTVQLTGTLRNCRICGRNYTEDLSRLTINPSIITSELGRPFQDSIREN